MSEASGDVTSALREAGEAHATPAASPTSSERIRSLQEEANSLREQLRLQRLERDVLGLREEWNRQQTAGSTHAANPQAEEDEEESADEEIPRPELDGVPQGRRSRSAQSTRRDDSSEEQAARKRRHKPKEPRVFKADTANNARAFIRELTLVFKLTGDLYDTDEEKVTYALGYLSESTAERWENTHDLDNSDDLNWDDFKEWVLNSVGDPANRMLSVLLEWENARQGEHQSARKFALQLEALEKQLYTYTEEQKVGHYLAKLKPALRQLIAQHHAIPKTREELVIMADRIETIGNPSRKRNTSDPPEHRNENRKKKSSDARGKPADSQRGGRGQQTQGSKSQGKSKDKGKDRDKDDHLSGVTCWNCNETGHYSNTCDKPKKETVRAVKDDKQSASDKQKNSKSGKGKGSA